MGWASEKELILIRLIHFQLEESLGENLALTYFISFRGSEENHPHPARYKLIESTRKLFVLACPLPCVNIVVFLS